VSIRVLVADGHSLLDAEVQSRLIPGARAGARDRAQVVPYARTHGLTG
jgi:hypothetical protein